MPQTKKKFNQLVPMVEVSIAPDHGNDPHSATGAIVAIPERVLSKFGYLAACRLYVDSLKNTKVLKEI